VAIRYQWLKEPHPKEKPERNPRNARNGGVKKEERSRYSNKNKGKATHSRGTTFFMGGQAGSE
jgi:hypothetical protein